MSGDFFAGMVNGFLMGLASSAYLWRKEIEGFYRLRDLHEPEPYTPPTVDILGLRSPTLPPE